MLRNKMMQDLRLAGYALKTQKTYLECIGLFAQFCWEPAQAEQEGVRSSIDDFCPFISDRRVTTLKPPPNKALQLTKAAGRAMRSL